LEVAVAPVTCALDLGSSLIKAALVDEAGTIVATTPLSERVFWRMSRERSALSRGV
jgi:sugar (pentulose or hexulose) kinase